MQYLNQRDKRWSSIKLGFGTSTIGSHGCFLTCLSMIVDKTPPEVNEILKKAGAFYKDLIISDKAAAALGLRYLGKETDINKPPTWYPSIKEVDMSPAPGKTQHFVLRILFDGRKRIIDPWTGQVQKIDFYPFTSYRLFKK